jgi:hypothetical protein
MRPHPLRGKWLSVPPPPSCALWGGGQTGRQHTGAVAEELLQAGQTRLDHTAAAAPLFPRPLPSSHQLRRTYAAGDARLPGSRRWRRQASSYGAGAALCRGAGRRSYQSCRCGDRRASGRPSGRGRATRRIAATAAFRAAYGLCCRCPSPSSLAYCRGGGGFLPGWWGVAHTSRRYACPGILGLWSPMAGDGAKVACRPPAATPMSSVAAASLLDRTLLRPDFPGGGEQGGLPLAAAPPLSSPPPIRAVEPRRVSAAHPAALPCHTVAGGGGFAS